MMGRIHLTYLQEIIPSRLKTGNHPIGVDLGPLRERWFKIRETSHTRPGVFVGSSEQPEVYMGSQHTLKDKKGMRTLKLT